MRIDWAAKIPPDQLVKGAFVTAGICMAAVLWYVGNVTTNLNQDNRMDKIEARLTTDERLNDKWQSDEKENLTAIRISVDRLLDATNHINLEVARLMATGSKGDAAR